MPVPFVKSTAGNANSNPVYWPACQAARQTDDALVPPARVIVMLAVPPPVIGLEVFVIVIDAIRAGAPAAVNTAEASTDVAASRLTGHEPSEAAEVTKT